MRRRTRVILAAEALAAVAVFGLFALEIIGKPQPTEPAFAVAQSAPSPAPPSAPPAPSPSPTPTAEPFAPVTLAFCGDILLDGGVKAKIYGGGFEAVITDGAMEPFQTADIAFVDLELPFSARGEPVPDKEYNFRGDPEHLQLLSDMGVDIVTVANNHTLDYGEDAFLDTLDSIAERGMAYVGGGRDKAEAMAYAVFGIRGVKVACLAASRVISDVSWYASANRPGLFGTYDPTELNAQIAAAKAEADVAVVFAHWGVERNDLPEAYQQAMARGYIDAGADAVVACHPHVLQGFEYYKGKPIAYSLGNFIFTDGRKDTAALTVSFDENINPGVRLTPCEIVDRQTRLMTDEARLAALRAHLNEISFGAYVDGGWNVVPAE